MNEQIQYYASNNKMFQVETSETKHLRIRKINKVLMGAYLGYKEEIRK